LSFHLYFEHGAELGYGVALNNLEVAGAPAGALRVRYVEPRSDAAVKGVQRGDQVISINGRSAAELIGAGDFSALAPNASGEQATLVLRSVGADRTVVLSASRYAITPVAGTSVTTTVGGRRLGYLMVKDMLFQAERPIDDAFATLAAQGVQDLVLDLRYNGAGFVSVGRLLASYVAGGRASGQAYASLRFNDKRALGSDRTYHFVGPSRALNLARVFVLTGPRSCAAAEQVINGLRGAGIEVIAIGGTTCGKPFGSEAVVSCGTAYAVVNFEVFNARNEGRYFNGLAPQCRVADDLGTAPGAANDPLLVAAGRYADSGACPAGTLAAPAMPVQAAVWAQPGERGEALER
jgi:C-terminal processing protease CtpA/Prc